MNEIVCSTLGKKLKEALKKKSGVGMFDFMFGLFLSDLED